jgi:bifunctional oligoribonuclease and PAP phosphatase NrnA
MKNHIQNKIIKKIKKSNKIVITSHVSADGDAVGSELALYEVLVSLGKDVCVVNSCEVQDCYKFLKFSSDVIVVSDAIDKKTEKVSQTQEILLNYLQNSDLLITLDSPVENRVDCFSEYLDKANFIINIDHHVSNQNYADINNVNKNASSVGEMLFELFSEMKIKITPSIAEALFVSISTDTGCFCYANTGSRTLTIASELEKYIDIEKITNNVYSAKSIESYKLLSKALDSLVFNKKTGVAYMAITKQMFEDTNTSLLDSHDFIDYIRAINGVKVALIFKQSPEKNSEIKVSLRSTCEFDVNKFANKYKGGGHAKASGFTVHGNLEELVINVMKEIENG